MEEGKENKVQKCFSIHLVYLTVILLSNNTVEARNLGVIRNASFYSYHHNFCQFSASICF